MARPWSRRSTRFEPARPLEPVQLALRLPVQAIYKFDDRRIVAGRIESGHLAAGDEIVSVQVGTAEVRGTVTAIENSVDPGEVVQTHARTIGQNHVGDIEIALAAPIAVDLYENNRRTGRVVLEYAGRIAGGGLVLALPGEAKKAVAAVAAPLIARAVELSRGLADLDAAGRLAAFRHEVEGRIAFTTSFGLEDQVVAHMICEAGLDIDLVTLDTGRLFPETYATWEETEQRYGRRIRAIYPRHTELEALVQAQGINGFYRSREARAACCDVRKVEPLNRALAGATGWITGLRADQSAHREQIGLVAADPGRGLLKLSPLHDWAREAVRGFAGAHAVPYNPLHAKGFASIGCAPCTRAIGPGEPERAGRWWWEDESKKECGLHTAPGAAR
jgi:phosphoadenosine phosphosulfate reductase